MSNTRIWDALSKTDPKHTKGFKRAGGFGGTAIKPIYTTQKMTEEFGPAGWGWGMFEPTFQVVNGSEGQIAVYCTVGLWYMDQQTKSGPYTVYGVGGDMIVVKQSNGLRTDDEAFKKAFTDAVGNAMKHLGMSADVHMGLFEDSKYVREMQEEFAEPARTPSKATAKPVEAPKTFAAFGASITSAKTPDDLKDAFAVIWKSSLSQSDKDTLKTAYEAKKAEFIAPGNNFDAIARGDVK